MSLCRGDKKTICEFADGLRTSDKPDCFDMYLIGDIEPETIAAYIIHNNEFHNGWTYEQLGHLVRIMDCRNYMFDYNYNAVCIIKQIERRVDEYNYRKLLDKYKNDEESDEMPPGLLPYYGNDHTNKNGNVARCSQKTREVSKIVSGFGQEVFQKKAERSGHFKVPDASICRSHRQRRRQIRNSL